jgi:hypothetical protein
MRYTVRTKLRQLLAATLLVSGTLSIVGTAIADTPAGTAISNTANATYEDNDGQTFNATSNEVKVTVAEVAGVFVTPLSTIDRNGGNVLPNDIIDYEFKVTNTGNDTTEFFIPPTPTLSGPGSATQVLVAGYIDAQGNRVNFPTPILVPSGATKTSEITGLPGIPNPSGGTYPAGVVPADYALIVQVPVTVNALASSGSDLTVQLGNTANNDNTPGTQNQ